MTDIYSGFTNKKIILNYSRDYVKRLKTRLFTDIFGDLGFHLRSEVCYIEKGLNFVII